MQDLRDSRGLPKDDIAPQLVVPMGAHVSRIRPLLTTEVENNSLVYLGSLQPGKGIDVLIEAFTIVSARIRDLTLVIIGTGPLEGWLRSEVKKRALDNRVVVHGYIENHQEVERIMTKCAIGIAVYDPHPMLPIRFTDVGKVKTYLACGLPVIATPVSEFLSEVARHRAGLIVDYNPQAVASAVEHILNNRSLWEEYRKNSLILADDLDWDRVFSRALCQTLGI
jgi:glycosyltransferase involved in cell wall biosynthesis